VTPTPVPFILPPIPYQYAATLIEVHDGDTIRVDFDLGSRFAPIDLGFGFIDNMDCWFRNHPLRLYGINAPELLVKGQPNPDGLASRQWLEDQLPHSPGALTIQTHKDATEKYGRYLATVWIGSDTTQESINDKSVRLGYSVPYMVR